MNSKIYRFSYSLNTLVQLILYIYIHEFQDPPIEINDTYNAYIRLSEDGSFVKWPSRDVMPEGDYGEYNNTNMMGTVSYYILLHLYLYISQTLFSSQ